MHDVETLAEIPPWEWPADAAGTLLHALREGPRDEEHRLLAVELASSVTVMNDDLAAALLTILRDPAEADSVRGAAAIALGPTLEELEMDLDDWDDPEEVLVSPQTASAIREALREVYLDGEAPTEVRRRALEGSVRGLADWHEGAVRAAYHSGDPMWRLTGVFCMAHVRGFEPEILEALESGEPALRYEAVRAAGSWGLKRAWPHVRSIVETERADRELLLAAIEAVATIRPTAAEETLAPLIDLEDEEIADAVSEALGMAGIFDEDEEEW